MVVGGKEIRRGKSKASTTVTDEVLQVTKAAQGPDSWRCIESPLIVLLKPGCPTQVAEFSTEGVGRLSDARTRAGVLTCLWIPIMEEHRGWSLPGTKLQIRESSILMSVDCPRNLGFLRKMQLESGTSHKHILKTHADRLFLKESSIAILVFQPSPPFFLSSFVGEKSDI